MWLQIVLGLGPRHRSVFLLPFCIVKMSRNSQESLALVCNFRETSGKSEPFHCHPRIVQYTQILIFHLCPITYFVKYIRLKGQRSTRSLMNVTVVLLAKTTFCCVIQGVNSKTFSPVPLAFSKPPPSTGIIPLPYSL